jgi:hypothetical protein
VGDVTKGVQAGFIATVVISIIMVVQHALGFLPQVNIIAMWMSAAGMPNSPGIAWILHFAMGVGLWGTIFSVVSPHLPGPHWFRGAVFSVFTWLAMMTLFLTAAGLPVFAVGLGPTIPVATLVLHLIFGLVLGETYHLLLHYTPSEADENA